MLSVKRNQDKHDEYVWQPSLSFIQFGTVFQVGITVFYVLLRLSISVLNYETSRRFQTCIHLLCSVNFLLKSYGTFMFITSNLFIGDHSSRLLTMILVIDEAMNDKYQIRFRH